MPPLNIDRFCARAASANTMAAIASTMGTARGRTHGSCRPRPITFTPASSRESVHCSLAIVAVGLNATLKSKGCPEVIPPKTPPALFVFVCRRRRNPDSADRKYHCVASRTFWFPQIRSRFQIPLLRGWKALLLPNPLLSYQKRGLRALLEDLPPCIL